MNRSLLPALAAGLLAFSACNSADKSATASQPATTPPAENAAPPMASTTAAAPMAPVTDSEFITKVDEGGHNEMGLSKVVLMKNPSPTAKAYADKMIADHTKAGAELAPIAKAHGVKLMGMMDAEHQTIREAMLKMSGPDLEKKYMDQMVADHDKTVALFQSEITNGKEADVKGFATKTLPTIQQHDSMAKADDKMKM
ncbi:DUF4142 domain-containing protein [Hymenobacter nivis]|uniref:DUF4142 domain-containing protein n=1 Tax=Hymenobacter nivis TaxID=1850093 RepID=A0A2Z3GIW8_9BACT|nr:DUF4142 domain-containing protein [Hymenobacter nivis]AWM34079.1 hypothetical protein DDQ68_15565 [Hymenobacter nivis]